MADSKKKVTWQSLEWKEKAAAFVEGKCCAWCETTENLVPHHPKKKGSYTHDEYMDLERFCVVLCGKCNFMESKGYRLCPVCKKGYYKPKRKFEPMCWSCFVKTSFGKRVAERMKSHPEEYKRKRRKKTRK